MDKDFVLRVEGLGKKFCRTLKRSLFYGTVDIARSMIGMDYRTDYLRPAEFWALDDINFNVIKGEKLGFLGSYGSGKTTLLRIINGIFPPDTGKIDIKGRIGALIAVGAGFHPHMTGRENIYLNGTILGMTRREIDQKVDEIIEFSEIGEFVDAPVATYSSGMTVRLGFSIAIHSQVDIMLVDEILAVGDLAFTLKCQKRLSEFRQQGGTFIIVSHNMQTIRNTCERVIWIDKGKIISDGEVFKICNDYENYSLKHHRNIILGKKKEILNYDNTVSLRVNILNRYEIPIDSINCGEAIIIRIDYQFHRLIAKPIFTISALSQDGIILFENYSENNINNLLGEGSIYFEISSFQAKPQLYLLTVALSENEILNKLEWHNNYYELLILSNDKSIINQGITNFLPKWNLNTIIQ